MHQSKTINQNAGKSYLLPFSILNLVSLNIKLPFLIESHLILFSLLNNLQSHFFFPFLLLL